MRLQTTQIYNVDGNFEPVVGNIILDEGVCEHEQTWKEVKSKDGETVQHSILTTACLHKKERSGLHPQSAWAHVEQRKENSALRNVCSTILTSPHNRIKLQRDNLAD